MKRAVITGLGIVSCLGNDRTYREGLTNKWKFRHQVSRRLQ
ncbi:MAG: hypothetical protein CM15mP51_24340 [Porticoccaceae bacterium]|nr:MAG: hypothetical protein CM15mP51_24340 [Porticoccaceae bacterium]